MPSSASFASMRPAMCGSFRCPSPAQGAAQPSRARCAPTRLPRRSTPGNDGAASCSGGPAPGLADVNSWDGRGHNRYPGAHLVSPPHGLNLSERLIAMNIDEATCADIRELRPLVAQHIDAAVDA